MDLKVSEICLENQKYKFIHQNLYRPFKVLLIDCNAFMLILETFFYIRFSVFGLAIRVVFDFFIISSWLLKRVPRSNFLSQLNKNKSRGARSVESGGC